MPQVVVSVPSLDPCELKESSLDLGEMVRLRGRPGLYEVRGIDQESGTVQVLRNIPRHPIEEKVPFEALCRLDEPTAQVIARFLMF